MADIAGLHLQQDRISDLVAEVDTEARSYAGRSESCCGWPKAAASHARR